MLYPTVVEIPRRAIDAERVASPSTDRFYSEMQAYRARCAEIRELDRRADIARSES